MGGSDMVNNPLGQTLKWSGSGVSWEMGRPTSGPEMNGMDVEGNPERTAERPPGLAGEPAGRDPGNDGASQDLHLLMPAHAAQGGARAKAY